jgi:putative protease
VQDLGIVRLIQRVYPELEVHGSTQMTVHDASGARVMREIGIERVVLARENTLDDVRAIREAVPDIGSRRSCTARCASRTAASATCRG